MILSFRVLFGVCFGLVKDWQFQDEIVAFGKSPERVLGQVNVVPGV